MKNCRQIPVHLPTCQRMIKGKYDKQFNFEQNKNSELERNLFPTSRCLTPRKE